MKLLHATLRAILLSVLIFGAIFTVAAIMAGSLAFGQATAIPFSKPQFFSSAGAPLASGKLCTFSAGTTTPLTSYTTSAGSGGASNANPVVLDSAGRADIFFTNGTSYKWILYAAGGNASCPNSGTTIWSEDNQTVGQAVATSAGTAGYLTKFTSSSAVGIGSIYDGYTGESMRIQADNTLSIGSTTDKAAGLYIYTPETEVAMFETTGGSALMSFVGTSGTFGYLTSSVATGMTLASGQSAMALDYATATVTPGSTDTHAFGTAALRWNTGNIKGITAITIALSSGTSAGLTLSGAAPTISSGFGTSPSVTGTAAAMRVNVGTGGTATAGVIGMPTAAVGWNCVVANLTALDGNVANTRTVQLSSTTTTVTVEHQTISTGAALVWTASDIVAVSCLAY